MSLRSQLQHMVIPQKNGFRGCRLRPSNINPEAPKRHPADRNLVKDVASKETILLRDRCPKFLRFCVSPNVPKVSPNVPIETLPPKLRVRNFYLNGSCIKIWRVASFDSGVKIMRRDEIKAVTLSVTL